MTGASGEGVDVRKNEVAVVGVLQFDAAFHRADPMAQVEFPGGGVAGEDAGTFGRFGFGHGTRSIRLSNRRLGGRDPPNSGEPNREAEIESVEHAVSNHARRDAAGSFADHAEGDREKEQRGQGRDRGIRREDRVVHQGKDAAGQHNGGPGTDSASAERLL